MAKRKKQRKEQEPFLVGYARVSTQDQNLDLQTTALRKAGVKEDNLNVEKISATAKNRPALDLAIKDLRPGDTLLVWRLDRFARSMRNLYAQLDRIYAKGAKFKSLTENFDFDTFTGKFVLGILGLVAELERQLISHRTAAGIKTWKDKTGQDWGRQRVMTEKLVVRAGKLLNGGMSGPKVAAKFGLSTAAIYGYWQLDRKADERKFVRKTISQ